MLPNMRRQVKKTSEFEKKYTFTNITRRQNDGPAVHTKWGMARSDEVALESASTDRKVSSARCF